MFIMGTAGHIDHGKTTLITALSGINPDRLQEEQTRGMTVDLGFAWFTLPEGNVGVVDVPGHHRLVKNMLAGVGQMDFTLLVIAADDGWMPQTQEHVDILHLYGVKHGVVAVTKADLVEPDWLNLVIADIEDNLADTTLANFSIIPVSAISGFNLVKLKETISNLLVTLPRADSRENPILWIDRVFTIKGAGTVVTGSLLGGNLTVGMEVVIQPGAHTARIRGLQTQTQTVETGLAHSRLAINLTGVEKTEITRGMYLALPEKRPCVSLINAQITMLPQGSSSLENLQYVKLYVGTLETLAHVKVLQDTKLEPGQEGYVQLQLEEPAHFSFQDRFILRHSELQNTLGGGYFIEEAIPVRGLNLRLVGPKRLNHLFPFEKPEAFLDLTKLKAKAHADLDTFSLLKAEDQIFWKKDTWLNQGYKLHPDLIEFGEFIMSPDQLQKVQNYLITSVTKFHQEYPLMLGPNKETLRTETSLPARLFDQILNQIDCLKESSGAVRSIDHHVTLNQTEAENVTALVHFLEERSFEPPTLNELLQNGYGKDLIFAASHLEKVVPLAGDHWTSPVIIATIIDFLFTEDAFQKEFELAIFRDRIGASRKFALAFLEYFDSQGVTRRKGDVRILGKHPK